MCGNIQTRYWNPAESSLERLRAARRSASVGRRCQESSVLILPEDAKMTTPFDSLLKFRRLRGQLPREMRFNFLDGQSAIGAPLKQFQNRPMLLRWSRPRDLSRTP